MVSLSGALLPVDCFLLFFVSSEGMDTDKDDQHGRYLLLNGLCVSAIRVYSRV